MEVAMVMAMMVMAGAVVMMMVALHTAHIAVAAQLHYHG
jgi:hypothetical protein